MKETAPSSKNSKDVYGAEGKSNVLFFNPDKLVIVTDPKRRLFDRRGLSTPSEEFVLNVMTHGVHTPIGVWKNPETGETEVVFGRRRVLGLREANTRLKAQGLQPHQIPAVVKRGSEETMTVSMIIENEIREEDSPIALCEKTQRLVECGRSEEEIAVICGVSKATVHNRLKLLEATSAVKKALESGKIKVSTAYELARMAPEVQREKIDLIVKAGGEAAEKKDKSRKRARRVREIVQGEKDKKEHIRSPHEIAECRKHVQETKRIDDNDRMVALAVLDWVFGKETLNKFMARTIVIKDEAS
jgi:ParB family chromosome partitioning protein